MSQPHTALELWPLVQQLSHDEQLRLAKLVLHSASREGGDAAAYANAPISLDEFSSSDDPLAWEGEGWEQFSAAR